jgi:hypothetical protein
MSNLTRYENQARNTRDIDRDGDGQIDGFNSRDRPVYAIDCSRRGAIWVWYKAGFKLLWFFPFAFLGAGLFFNYVIRPIVLTAPVALIRNNPRPLTETEAGGELNAATNNLVVGFRAFAGSGLESAQESQARLNAQKSNERPAENLIPRAEVRFIDN